MTFVVKVLLLSHLQNGWLDLLLHMAHFKFCRGGHQYDGVGELTLSGSLSRLLSRHVLMLEGGVAEDGIMAFQQRANAPSMELVYGLQHAWLSVTFITYCNRRRPPIPDLLLSKRPEDADALRVDNARMRTF